MAYKISDDCISCGACEAECPVSAISEGDGKYEITYLPRWRSSGRISDFVTRCL